jgi:hypothetical protein
LCYNNCGADEFYKTWLDSNHQKESNSKKIFISEKEYELEIKIIYPKVDESITYKEDMDESLYEGYFSKMNEEV